MKNKLTKKSAIREINTALFVESGVMMTDKMIFFLNKQTSLFLNDLANLIRYYRGVKKWEFERELTKAGYKESAETFTYFLI